MVETNPSGTVLKTQYLHADHQGSVKAVSDTSGAVIERMGYDAWGKRSDALSHSTTRGYTAHEMLDNVGLIHMNGRVYDPLLARFLSVDPINQAPDNAQSHNPYSYVFNSPMMFTDPSGFSTWAKYRRPVVGVAASVLTYGMATYAMTGAWFAENVANVGLAKFGASVMAGGVGGGIQSGTVEGALKGAVMAAAFYGVGSGAEQIASAGGTNAAIAARSVQVMGHAAVACAGAVASGGQCGPAALAQGFTSGVSPYLPDGYVAGTAANAVVGGLAAKLAGGDSRQGALTGAYAYLFNYCAHNGCFDKPLTSKAAIAHGGAAKGASITDVDPLTLEWDKASIKRNKNGSFWASWESVSTESGKVYGNLDKIRITGGKMDIPADDYDFEWRNPLTANEGFGATMVRNILTLGGRVMQESTYVKYDIQFRQEVTVPDSVAKFFRNVPNSGH